MSNFPGPGDSFDLSASDYHERMDALDKAVDRAYDELVSTGDNDSIDNLTERFFSVVESCGQKTDYLSAKLYAMASNKNTTRKKQPIFHRIIRCFGIDVRYINEDRAATELASFIESAVKESLSKEIELSCEY